MVCPTLLILDRCMQMKKALSILIIMLFVACSVSKKNIKAKKNKSGNTVTLNGKSVNSRNGELIISRDSISLEFDILPYNSETKELHVAQIAATSDDSNLKYFQEGPITNNNPFYSPTGTWIVPSHNNTYNCMYVGNSGHHYIYYESESDKRATLIKKYKNGKVRLKWSVNCFSIDKKDIQINNSIIDQLYLMVFIDQNLNDIIEKGEYSLFKIKFKE